MTRRDGVLKVTGAAHLRRRQPPRRACSTRSTPSAPSPAAASPSLDVAAAKAHPGVVEVITPANRPPLAQDPDAKPTMFSWRIEALQDDRVRYANQPIALVVAETLEAATEGARLLAPTYEAEPARIGFDGGVPFEPQSRRDRRPAELRAAATSTPASPPPRTGSRPRSRRRSSTTTPWSRMPSSPHGTATG